MHVIFIINDIRKKSVVTLELVSGSVNVQDAEINSA